MPQRKIYTIASRLNGDEFLIMVDIHGEMGPPVYITLEDAKSVFDDLYETYRYLLAHDPMASKELLFYLVNFYPVIIAINEDKALETIGKWRAGGILFTPEQNFLSDPHLYAPMKPGFIHKFQKLDIVKDIESITSVGPDGNIIIQEFRINYGFKNEPNEIKTPTEEELKEILRKRGLM